MGWGGCPMDIDFRILPRFREHAYRITQLVAEWAIGYEVHQDAIIRQLGVAHAWISSNPRKAPKKDVVRFLFNWMRKAKEHGNLRVPVASRKREPEPEPEMTYEEMVEIRRRNMVPQGSARV